MGIAGVTEAFLDGGLTLHLRKGAKFDRAAVAAILESHGATVGEATEGEATLF